MNIEKLLLRFKNLLKKHMESLVTGIPDRDYNSQSSPGKSSHLTDSDKLAGSDNEDG